MLLSQERKIAEKYNLVPVFTEDKIDGSDVVTVEWAAVLPILERLTEQYGTVTTEYHDSVVQEAQRQIHGLEGQLLAAQTTIAAALALCDTYSFQIWHDDEESYGVVVESKMRDTLSRADLSALAEHDKKVADAALFDYISTKETTKVQVEFTNQPVFDTVIRTAKADVLRESSRLLEGTFYHVREGETPFRSVGDYDGHMLQPHVQGMLQHWFEDRADSIEQTKANRG